MNRPRTALVACTCGNTLCGRLDYERIGAGWTAGPLLVARDLCLPEGSVRTASWLREQGADGVVIAACSAPPLSCAAAGMAAAGGVRAHRIAVVDIREGCAWVHPETDRATEKARRMIAAASAGLSEAVQPPVENPANAPGSVLLVGSSPAGAAAAARLSSLGCPMILLDGHAGGAEAGPPPHPSHTDDRGQVVRGTLTALNGQAGGFRARIRNGAGAIDLTVGAVIVAAGEDRVDADAARAQASQATSLWELERRRQQGSMAGLPEGQTVVFLVEAPPWPVVTESLLRVALLLTQQRGCLSIVIFRDLGVAAAGLEELYKDARGAGVLFIRLGTDEPTVSQTENGKWQVSVNVPGLGTITEVADVLIHCDTPPPADLDGLRHALGVALGSGQSADADRMHLEPVFTERAGVFWVGSSRSPGTSGQAGRLGEAAAMAAALVASAGPGEVEAPAIVDTARCALCLTCFRVCPHQAMVIDTGPAMRVLTSACQGCGICASACPAGAIQVVNADGRRILAEIDALLDDPMPGQDPVVVFACANSAVPAAQALGRLRRSYPSRVLLVQVPCLGRIESIHCLRPLAGGAEQVLLCGCFDRSCEHLNGPSRARVAVDRASALIEAVGLNSKAVQVASMAPVDWHRLARLFDAVGDRPPSAHTPDQTETPIGAVHGAP